MYHGSSVDRYREFVDDSTSHKLKSAYWSTKQAVIKKLGKEEDKHVVASDAELDSKLALFKSVQTTCQDITLCVESYLKSIYVLSQAENDMGRFLKKKSADDKTRAGKMLSAVGKALSHSAQQRLMLQNPLNRLEQEVDTFRNRAIGDTEITIQRMETARTQYRGALLWMKNVSNELDPDMYKKLDKFRRVQTQVRKSKSDFDRLKLASMQKVDLLAASRCNMLSQVLATYQDTLLQYWERSARTMTTVANSFKGYQFYEFSLLKNLAPEMRKLADQTNASGDEAEGMDKSKSTEEPNKPDDLPTEEEIDKRLTNLFDADDLLLNENLVGAGRENDFNDLIQSLNQEGKASNLETSGNEEQDFLNEILSLDPSNLHNELGQTVGPGAATGSSASGSFTPFLSEIGKQGSDEPLFSVNWDSQMTDVFGDTAANRNVFPSISPISGGPQQPNEAMIPSTSGLGNRPMNTASGMPHSKPPSLNPANRNGKPQSANLDEWMNFFADLTPLGNPDQQSKKSGHVLDA